ncbi:hypothetical protein Tco_0080057 [Tanacetum coccineum]
MADKNVPTPAPTRSDDQILPFASWVPIGKSNYVLDLQKKQKNPICQISVDILQNTNFFRAFTASASLDELALLYWDANLLREALEITPIDQAHQFVSPPSGDAIMDFVNELGYTEARLLGMIGLDIQFFRCLWGIITSTNVDYAKLMWEEFVQAIQTFLTDKANLGSPTKKGRKDKPHKTSDEDKQIPSVGVFDELFSIWKAFGGNTRDLGSFGEETDKIMNLHQHLSRISTQKLKTASRNTRDAITTPTMTASQVLTTASAHTTQPKI